MVLKRRFFMTDASHHVIVFYMKKYFLFCLLSVVSIVPMMAQDKVDTLAGGKNYSDFPEGRRVMVYVNLGNSVGSGLFRDRGTSPLTYSGPVLRQDIDVEVRLRKWRIVMQTNILGGFYDFESGKGISAYGIDGGIWLKGMYRAWQKKCWQLWTGISLGDEIGVKYNPSFENASIGLTNVLGLNLHALMELRTPVRPSGAHWIFHGELMVMPVGSILRPGYAFIDNYSDNSDGVLYTLLSTYESNTAAFPSFGTDFGAAYVLRSGNRVGLSYRWGYFTSGNSGAHRYDEANHMITANLMILL